MKKFWIPICLFALVLPVPALASAEDDFNQNCSKCHGGNARTNALRARRFGVDIWKMYLPYSKITKEDMKAVIEKGRGKMPAFKDKLTPEQINGIADYLIAKKKELPPDK